MCSEVYRAYYYPKACAQQDAANHGETSGWRGVGDYLLTSGSSVFGQQNTAPASDHSGVKVVAVKVMYKACTKKEHLRMFKHFFEREVSKMSTLGCLVIASTSVVVFQVCQQKSFAS